MPSETARSEPGPVVRRRSSGSAEVRSELEANGLFSRLLSYY